MFADVQGLPETAYLDSVVATLHPSRHCQCSDHTGDERWHGTLTGYTRHRCECLDCMEAMRRYYRTPQAKAAHRDLNLRREQARRARKFGCAHEDYTVTEIAERDNWTCQLCEHPIDPSLRFPDPGSFSVDHIIPLARGGHDAKTNVQATHLRCNLRKGSRTE